MFRPLGRLPPWPAHLLDLLLLRVTRKPRGSGRSDYGNARAPLGTPPSQRLTLPPQVPGPDRAAAPGGRPQPARRLPSAEPAVRGLHAEPVHRWPARGHGQLHRQQRHQGRCGRGTVGPRRPGGEGHLHLSGGRAHGPSRPGAWCGCGGPAADPDAQSQVPRWPGRLAG